MKQQKQLIALAALLLVAAGIWYWNSQQTPVVAGASIIATNYQPMNVDNLILHPWGEQAGSHKTAYENKGRNPFSAVPPPPPPPPPPPKPGDPNYVEPPPPPPPRAEIPNMKYFGYGTVPNGTARRAYLSDGDEVYIVAEGDTLLGRYRILKIGNATLDFEDVSSHAQGQKNLEEAGPSGQAPGS